MFNSPDNFKILILIALLIINFIPFVYYLKYTKGAFFILPFTPFIISYLLNYPVKALLLFYPPIRPENIDVIFQFTIDELLFSLIFATAFYLCFIWVTIHYVKKLDLKICREKVFLLLDHSNTKRVLTVFSTLILIISGYIFLSENFFGLTREYKNTFLDNIILQFYGLNFVIILFNILLYKRTNKKNALFFASLLILAVLINSAFTTAKGPLIILFFIYLIMKTIFKERINLKVVTLAFSLFIIFWVYSYSSRYFGNVQDVKDINDLILNYEKASDNSVSAIEISTNALFNRFEHLQNLIYTIKRVNNIDKGIFVFGSTAELLNFIPSLIWPDRPFTYFNYFVVSDIFQSKYVSSAAIGRIGEAYFVLGLSGFLMGLFYAYLFSYLFKKFYYKTRVRYYIFIYFNLYLMYFITDNYLFQGILSVVYSNMFLIGTYLLISKNNKIRTNKGLD